MAFQCFNNLSPLYTNDLFKPAGQNTTTTRTSLFKLSQPLRKTSHRQNSLSYVAPSIARFLKNNRQRQHVQAQS